MKHYYEQKSDSSCAWNYQIQCVYTVNATVPGISSAPGNTTLLGTLTVTGTMTLNNTEYENVCEQQYSVTKKISSSWVCERIKIRTVQCDYDKFLSSGFWSK